MMFLEESPTHSVRNLVAEANHRIANSLSAVSALVQHQISGLAEDRHPMHPLEVRQLLGEVRARLDAVARLHRALSDLPTDQPIDISGYVQQIAAELVATLSAPGAVVLHFAGELNCRAKPEKAVYVGLIVVELVTNSLKYAHPAGVRGTIDMKCSRRAGSLVIEVADDGVGLPDGFDPATSRNGLRMVESLCRQLGGTVRFRSDDLGLTCIVEAPILID
jgi:two-component sensor histidine kinase